jgi:hypothetical protein
VLQKEYALAKYTDLPLLMRWTEGLVVTLIVMIGWLPAIWFVTFVSRIVGVDLGVGLHALLTVLLLAGAVYGSSRAIHRLWPHEKQD